MTAPRTPRRAASIAAASRSPSRSGRARAHRIARAVALAIASLCVTSARTSAQRSNADELYDEGYRLMARGKLVEACEAFEAANRAEPGAGTLIAIGECRERNQQLASAWSAYKAALTRVRSDEKRQFATARLTELEPRLSHLTVSVPAGAATTLIIMRNGVALDPALWNRPQPVDGGEYVIAAQAPGHDPWQTTVQVPAERGDVTAAIPALAIHEPSAPAVASPGWPMRRKVAIASAATAVAAVATGAVLGYRARRDHEDAHSICRTPPPSPCADAARANSLNRSAHNLSIGADVAFGVAGLAAIAAGLLWYTGSHDASQTAVVVPAVSPGQLVVTAARRF